MSGTTLYPEWTEAEMVKEREMWEKALPNSASLFAVQHANKQAELYRLALLGLRVTEFTRTYDTPPSDWEWFDKVWGGYCGYGERGTRGFVDGVDDTNNGDVHSHGSSVGEWSVIKKLRQMTGLDPEPL